MLNIKLASKLEIENKLIREDVIESGEIKVKI